MKKFVALLGVVILLTNCLSSTQQRQDQVIVTRPVTNVVPTIELAITPSPLPDYLGMVEPEPGQVYSVAEYKIIASSIHGWGATVPGICLWVRPLPLLEPGDFPTREEWLARVHLIVDDRAIKEYHSIFMNDSLGIQVADPETGEVLFKTPDGSPYGVCYAVSLEAGRHVATFVAEKTSSEEMSYTWQFVITE